ncbi:WD repeat-containing protein 6-like [Actinia tenebrosa]|uniref:tRNA (34-2'-O)-methyltransferase regulator WDR6 n=1 Tax=Actinia tenebrosa TaxID=6105 RepID=A0A6P8IPY1_ACTTE|nr:WD repeat-containing protein 6-like [Actinia tenebrosa]
MWIMMKKTALISSVTSLGFVKDLILSGQGPNLSIYHTVSGEKILSDHVLGNSRIHVIKVNEKEKSLVAISGQKIMRVVEIISTQASVKIENKTSLLSFPDLILDVHWLHGENGKSNAVAIATAHNAVWYFNMETGIRSQVAQCEETSILYSAQFFGKDLNNLLLASGTVFNQVLLWKVKGAETKEKSIKVLSKLCGHEGVIFKINFNKSGTLMTSVSDDRSIRLWKLTHAGLDFTGEVQLLLILYGHSARVWDAKVLTNFLVSIGEDAVCNVWNYDGKLVKTFSGHKGRSIWSLAISKDEHVIATGGGDGSIRLFSLEDINSKESMVTAQAFLPGTAEQLKLNKKGGITVDSPRSVSLVTHKKSLIMTSEGYLYEYTWREKPGNTAKSITRNTLDHQPEGSDSMAEWTSNEWKLLLHDPNYSSYSLMAVSSDHKYVAFGNLQGSIKVQETSFSLDAKEVKPFTSKVLSLLWSVQTASHSLFSCGPEGIIIWWHVFKDSQQVLQMVRVRTFCIPYSKQRWPSAVEVLDQDKMSTKRERKVGNCHIVFGDRKGSLHLFDARRITQHEVLDPVHSLPVIHGRIGVTQLCAHDNSLYSAGRDGTYRQYRLLDSILEVIDTKKVFKGLEWVEKLIFLANGDLVIAGFHTAYFVVWSVERNQPVFKVKCGGGHRAWDFVLNQNPESQNYEAVFTYLKGNSINVHLEQLRNSIAKPVLQTGFHGREATCLCYVDSLPLGKQGFPRHHVFLTGSEDTTINMMSYNSTVDFLTKVFTAQGHISSIRTLSVTRCRLRVQKQEDTGETTIEGTDCSMKYLLFSGGGRASLRCWRVDLSAIKILDNECVASSPPVSHICEYSSRSSNQRRKRRRQLGQNICSEIRFMSLTSLSMSVILDDESFQDKSWYLYGIAAACSDGFVRIFIFDEKNSKFFLLAQSDYLQRCVLTVNHLIHHNFSGRHSVLIFAGDTAGKISVWDITDHLIEYVRDEDAAEEADDAATTNKSDLHREDGNELVQNCTEGHLCCYSLVEEHEKNNFSCITPAENSLGRPIHVFRAHQSGVNDISIHKGCASYVLCSGGDDSGLFVAELNLCSAESGSRGIVVIREETVQSAHTSSVTGIRIIDSSRIVSSSTDQRLKLWNIDSNEDSTTNNKFIRLSKVEFVDVPDVQAIETWETWKENGRCTTIGVCGVGLQMLLVD